MNKNTRLAWLAASAGLLALSSTSALAVTANDAAGDFVANYTGVKGGDLDVLSSDVIYNTSTDMFTITATMAAAIGTTQGTFYIWGFDHGGPTANTPFAALGAGNVRFNTTLRLNQDGSGTAGSVALPAGTAVISGSTISVTFSGADLPTIAGGFAKADYTWNLWPRYGGPNPGTQVISDFAPDNAMAAITAVPEPATLAMMGLGMGVLALLRRRR